MNESEFSNSIRILVEITRILIDIIIVIKIRILDFIRNIIKEQNSGYLK